MAVFRAACREGRLAFHLRRLVKRRAVPAKKSASARASAIGPPFRAAREVFVIIRDLEHGCARLFVVRQTGERAHFARPRAPVFRIIDE
jgi:hypothetical protein